MTILKVLIVSALPLLELRAGLPLAIFLGLSKLEAFGYSIAGNLLGLLLAYAVLDFMMPYLKKVGPFRWVYYQSTLRVRRKRERYRRLGYLALYLVVAVPLPGTGAWTAALASFLFGFHRQKSLAVISAGIVTAALLVLAAGVYSVRGFRHFAGGSLLLSSLLTFNIP